jgi:hypothetical protein
MAARPAYKVVGYKETIRDLKEFDKNTRRDVRATFRRVGDKVKAESAAGIAEHDVKSAARVRTYVRQRGVSVEQSLRRTTGLHPEWGPWQMRHGFLPALADNKDDLLRDIDHALEEAAARFNQGTRI